MREFSVGVKKYKGFTLCTEGPGIHLFCTSLFRFDRGYFLAMESPNGITIRASINDDDFSILAALEPAEVSDQGIYPSGLVKYGDDY